MSRPRCLYLATFDPTVQSTGTCTRGQMFLRHFAGRYETHLVYLAGPDGGGRDEALIAALASRRSLGFSPLAYFLASPALYRAAAEVLEDNAIDFIFADFEKAGLYARMLGRRFGVPYVYNSHNVEYRRYIDVAPTNRLRYPLVPWVWFVERFASLGAALTVSISEPDAKIFRRWVPEDRLMVLPCAFDEQRVRPAENRDANGRPVVLMVGNYRNAGNREGAYTLREKILPRVVEACPDVVFRCVGNAFPEDLRHPNLEAVGFVDDLMAEYDRAAVIVAPISMGGGIKIKAIEALACGKCLVATEKAMEGIDPGGLENLRVAPIEEFAGHVIEAITTRPVTSRTNWDRMATGYGIHRQLEELCLRIEGVVLRTGNERHGLPGDSLGDPAPPRMGSSQRGPEHVGRLVGLTVDPAELKERLEG
jgi:glycosyltransferase involved in cell wall biosynthesis